MATATQSTGSGNFSLQRVFSLYKYNGPWLRKQTIMYAAFSLATAAVYLLSKGYLWQVAVYGFLGTILGVMYMLSPLVFVKGGDSRMIDRMVPASTAEKFSFYLSYILIVMPVACFVFPWIAESICPKTIIFGDLGTLANEIKQNTTTNVMFLQILVSIAAVITCLFCVLKCKSSRFTKAIISAFAVQIVGGVAESIFTVKEAFMMGYNAGTGANPSPTDAEFTEIVKSALLGHSTYWYAAIAVALVYIGLMSWLNYRTIHKNNL